MPKITKRTTIKTTAYLPPARYKELVARSERNHRSLTSEVLAAIEKAWQEDEAKAQGQALAQ